MIHGALIEYDPLQLYMGEDYHPNQYITIHQPSILEIAHYGEQEYFSMVYTLCAIPSDMKSVLYDMNIDYEKISDFQLFCILYNLFSVQQTSILFGEEFNLQDFIPMPYPNSETNEIYLFNPKTQCAIDKIIYQQIVDYIRAMHRIVPKIEKAMDKQTKRFLIDEDRMRRNSSKNKKKESMLLPLISSLLNHSYCSYTKQDLKYMQIYEFMDAIQRISLIMNVSARLQGMYSGFVDAKKIKPTELDWLKEIKPPKPQGLGFKLS